jgi:hypothetical protein
LALNPIQETKTIFDKSHGDIMQKKNNTKKGKNSLKVSMLVDRPVFFLAGILMLLIGLFIALGSLIHNTIKVFVNGTSHLVYGPLDWIAVIMGAIALGVGVILLMISKATKVKSSVA